MALLRSLQNLRSGVPFSVRLEALDDVEFEIHGTPAELLQVKHKQSRPAELIDTSVDLWKTLRVWLDALPAKPKLFLLTTETAAENSAAALLRDDSLRDPSRAHQILRRIANSDAGTTNAAAYKKFRTATTKARTELVERIHILDRQPLATEIDEDLRKEIFHLARKNALTDCLHRLEGWWYQLVLTRLRNSGSDGITSEELDGQLAYLREQYKLDALPLDQELLKAAIDTSGYREALFVRQLQLAEIDDARMVLAIKDFYRATEHRNKWVLSGDLLPGEIERYYDDLEEAWQFRFQQSHHDLRQLRNSTEETAKVRAAEQIYRWVENGPHPPLRPAMTVPAIPRGCLHVLSNDLRVGWHLDYKSRLPPQGGE